MLLRPCLLCGLPIGKVQNLYCIYYFFRCSLSHIVRTVPLLLNVNPNIVAGLYPIAQFKAKRTVHVCCCVVPGLNRADRHARHVIVCRRISYVAANVQKCPLLC